MSRNYYSSTEHFWSNERNEHKDVDNGIRVLSNIDKKLQRAFEILERDDYGYMSRSSYSGISGQIERCKEKNEKVWNYASTIHSILSDKENDFHRALSESMEELSLLNINDYEVDNTLGVKEYYTYADYSGSYGYQGASNAKLITGERLKGKINFADIMAKTDMFGLNQQFEQYLKEEKKNIYEMSDKEIAKYRNEFYTGVLTTSFNHKMESNLEGISEFLDYIPVVGGLKGIIEGCAGYTMTGEKLTTSERISIGVFGTLTLAVDVATLGALSATTTGAKAFAKEVGKMAFADIVIAGYGTKYTSEVMMNLGMSPEQVMMAHMVTSLAVGGYSSYKNYKNNLTDIMKNAGLDNIDQAKDLMKYTGLSSKELAKRLENSSIESILGIDKKNLDYLMKKTNMSSTDILAELNKQNISIDKINKSNIDEIIKKLNKRTGTTADIIDKVKNGDIVLETTKHKGNFGEINMDNICENEKKLNRISHDRVTSLDDKIHQGIDGVYEDPMGGPPRFVIGESKFGSSQLNTLSDGTRQMSYDWVADRLEASVGKEKAAEILFELEINPNNVQFTLFKTSDSSGKITEHILNKDGYIKK